MAPFAGLLFLLLCVCLSSGRLRKPEVGVVTTEQVPSFGGFQCGPPNYAAVISLNLKNQLSFSVPEIDREPHHGLEIQVKAIQQVAARRGIEFTPSQLATLRTLPFLALDIAQLPRFLSLSAVERSKLLNSQKLNPLTKEQLIECITAAKTSAISSVGIPLHLALKVDAEVKSPQIMHLIDLLQANGTNRFNLLLQWD